MVNNFYKRLTYGLSFALPILVVSGVLFSMSFMINTPFSGFLLDVSTYAYYLSYAVFAAGIAFAIADRVAMVPGLIGGFLLYDGTTGLLGALIIGFFAGFLTKALVSLFTNVPKRLIGIFPIFIYPVITTAMTLGLAYLLNQYASVLISDVNAFLFYDHHWLVIVFSVIFAAMMAFDMGGKINKIAYMIAIMTMANGLPSTIMAAVIAGGMVPPLVVSVIQMFHHKNESDKWWVTGILGLSFMTEGAIPFVENNRKIITPLMMIGSGAAGGIVSWFSLSTRIPHGGILITIFMNNDWYYFFLALLIGMVITFILLTVFSKKIKRKKTSETPLQA